MVLLGRISENIEGILIENQYGFRRGRGCSDMIHITRLITMKASEWQYNLYIAKHDLKSAFYTISHTYVLHCLRAAGISEGAVRAVM
eukprot:6933138-Heterocapsa_arctica.AAC.1